VAEVSAITTILYWAFHTVDGGFQGTLASEWRLCLTTSLLTFAVVLAIFRMGRL
jgi:hypothetical protein